MNQVVVEKFSYFVFMKKYKKKEGFKIGDWVGKVKAETPQEIATCCNFLGSPFPLEKGD